MEIINEFGVDPILLVAQIVNFLIIFFVLKKFLYKPILETLKNREETIKKGLNEAEEANLLLQKTQEREKEILRKAQDKARKMIEDAKLERQEELSKAEANTKLQVQKMLEEARSQISKETEEAERRLTSNVTELAIELIRRSSSELFTPAEQEKLLKTALSKLKKN